MRPAPHSVTIVAGNDETCTAYPVTRPPLLTELRHRAAYSEGAGIYRMLPSAVAVPRTVEEIRRLLGWARDRGTSLIPRGAGSGMPGGNVGSGIVVDLSQGFHDLEIDAGRRIARAGASVPAGRIAVAARSHGLRLPPDPSSAAFATSGGLVATNAAGPRSVRCGSVRRWVEAVDIVDADAMSRRIVRGGGGGDRLHLDAAHRRLIAERFPRTRKNSSGYALDAFAESGDELDLFIGSEGTLGIVTAVEWRLEPMPAHRAGVALGFGDLSALGDAVPLLLQLHPAAVELLDATLLDMVTRAGAHVPAGLACLLLIEFERATATAARGAVGDAARGLRHHAMHVDVAVDAEALDHLWAVRRLASPALASLPEARRSLQVVEDGCVPIDRLAAYVAGLRAASQRHEIELAIFGHAGDGHVHANALPDIGRPGWHERLGSLLEEVTALLQELAGTPSGEHGDGRLRAGLLERFWGPEVAALLRAVKHAYDPGSILNPGVIIPAADWAPLVELKIGDGATPIPDDIAARLRAIERGADWAVPKTGLADSWSSSANPGSR